LELKLTRPGMKFTRGVDYMGRVVDLKQSEIKFAIADMRIYQRSAQFQGGGGLIEMWALSPSQYEIFLAKRSIGELTIPRTGPQTRIPVRNPNHAAVAIGVLVGNNHILLGSDLEESGDTRVGWSAVVASANRPKLDASVFKIPHHGSRTAHHDETWRTLVS